MASTLTHAWWQILCGCGYNSVKRVIGSAEGNHLGPELWQDITALVEKLTVKVDHVDAHTSSVLLLSGAATAFSLQIFCHFIGVV